MKLDLSTEQVNQILDALAQQPYMQVHELINSIYQQGQSQLDDINNQQNNDSEQVEGSFVNPTPLEPVD